jgi:hypothetical protein
MVCMAEYAWKLMLVANDVTGRFWRRAKVERTLVRASNVHVGYMLSNLRPCLKPPRAECIGPGDACTVGHPFSDIHLDVTESILQRPAEERPVILPTWGNPLFLNSHLASPYGLAEATQQVKAVR